MKEKTDITIEEILDLLVYIGAMLIKNGSEMYRTEETVLLVGLSYGINVACFATPTTILISDENNSGYSKMKNIKIRKNNIMKIERINSFSRKVVASPMSYEDALKELREIDNLKSYPPYIILPACFVSCGLFSILYGGTFNDFFATGISALVMMCFVILYSKYAKLTFVLNLTGSMVATLIANLCFKIGMTSNLELVIVGSIIPLVPGIALTAGIRDSIYGDLMSGLARMSEALFVGISIAFGVGISLSIISFFGGVL